MDNYTSTGMTGKHGMERSRHEDQVTSTIEKTTARVPSVAFLSVAIGAIAGSLGFFIAGRRDIAMFVATWVPTILIMGNYNKIVKALEDVDTSGRGASAFAHRNAF